jgi:hypothetical protein
MKTVREIFEEALVLQRQGLRPRQISDQLIDIGHDNGYGLINERGSGGGGQPTTIELTFPDGDVIYFDGSDWQYRPA